MSSSAHHCHTRLWRYANDGLNPSVLCQKRNLPFASEHTADHWLASAAESDNTALVKLSNIINIDMKPFDPATYKEAEEEEEYVDDQGTRRVRVRDQNVIRWRRTTKEDGSSGIESNARSAYLP